jgi:hypothetical protein
MLSRTAAEELSDGVTAPLPRGPAGGFFMKIAGAIAMAIISKIAQMVRRSMDLVHDLRGQGRTRPDETDGSGRDGAWQARCP